MSLSLEYSSKTHKTRISRSKRSLFSDFFWDPHSYVESKRPSTAWFLFNVVNRQYCIELFRLCHITHSKKASDQIWLQDNAIDADNTSGFGVISHDVTCPIRRFFTDIQVFNWCSDVTPYTMNSTHILHYSI